MAKDESFLGKAITWHDSVQRIVTSGEVAIHGVIGEIKPKNHFKLSSSNKQKMRTLGIYQMYNNLCEGWENEQNDKDQDTLLLILNLLYYTRIPVQNVKMGKHDKHKGGQAQPQVFAVNVPHVGGGPHAGGGGGGPHRVAGPHGGGGGGGPHAVAGPHGGGGGGGPHGVAGPHGGGGGGGHHAVAGPHGGGGGGGHHGANRGHRRQRPHLGGGAQGGGGPQ